MTGTPKYQPQPITRPLQLAEIAPFLHSVVGLPPWERTQGEDAAALGRQSLPPVVRLDATGWIAWALGGLHVFAVPGEDGDSEGPCGPWVPSIRAAVSEAQRTATVLAMLRHGGNQTHAAAAASTSRRALRETLRRIGLYPWARALAELRGEAHHALERRDGGDHAI